tara:strand:- start:541 stop:1302 length:762 start_codon:yes stop_codon:yes gene_type:complete
MTNEHDEVLILFMGRSHAHAVTSIQHYTPDAVHIITSSDFRKPYVRRLNDWSKKYGFRKGTVQSVSDLFEPSSINSLLSCVFSVAAHEAELTEGNMETFRWKVGITGGTMHMAAVASMAAGLLDALPFYVMKPNKGEAVMPNKHVIEMPNLSALKTVMALNPLDLRKVKDIGEGPIEEYVQQTEIQPWTISALEQSGLIQMHPAEPRFMVTPLGHKVITMLGSGPMFEMLYKTEMDKVIAQQNMDDTERYYHG